MNSLSEYDPTVQAVEELVEELGPASETFKTSGTLICGRVYRLISCQHWCSEQQQSQSGARYSVNFFTKDVKETPLAN